MSAIFGIWNQDGKPVEIEQMRRMRDDLKHYGQDAQDMWIEGQIGVGCCMIRFDDASSSDIPVYVDTERELVLVGDVQLYNRDELIHIHHLTVDEQISNQALILEAYCQWGDTFPKYLNGDFVIAIWSKRDKRLLVARDHLGVRPLFYFNDAESFVFATDIKTLFMLPFVDKSLNEKVFYANMTKTVHFESEATCFANVFMLPQAHTLCVDEYGIHKKKYWKLGKNGKIRYKTEAEYKTALHTLVSDAISIRVQNANKKFASELSGGLDSSVIAILANRQLVSSGKTLEAFSWSPPFTYVPKIHNDERELLELVCHSEGITCTFYDPSLTIDEKNDVLAMDGSDLKVMRQEREVLSSRGYSILLSGWGGDQAISYRAKLSELCFHGYCGKFLKEIRLLSQGSPLRGLKALLSNTVLAGFKPYHIFNNTDKDLVGFTTTEFSKREERSCRKNVLTNSPVKHLESGYIQNRTEESALLDAAYGMQTRYPYLDYRVADFAMSIPRHFYYKNGVKRYIYREAFRDILPDEIYRFTSKNDIAKSTYFKNALPDTMTNLEKVISDLDRGVFSKYIDFDKLFTLLNTLSPDDMKNVLSLKRRILICVRIQQILQRASRKDK